MTIKKSSTPMQIKKSFDELFNSFTKEELIEQEARLLAFCFLSVIENALEAQKMSKKLLAEKVGTSASYITQLFRGDRLPNFSILSKIKDVLGIEFEVKAKEVQVVADNMTFEFPELERQFGFVSLYTNLKPNYGKRSEGVLKAEYNEGKAA